MTQSNRTEIWPKDGNYTCNHSLVMWTIETRSSTVYPFPSEAATIQLLHTNTHAPGVFTNASMDKDSHPNHIIFDRLDCNSKCSVDFLERLSITAVYEPFPTRIQRHCWKRRGTWGKWKTLNGRWRGAERGWILSVKSSVIVIIRGLIFCTDINGG